jgi:sensor histidine kinase YesM
MKKSFVVLLHIGFWLCYVILAAIILAVYYRTITHATNQDARIMNAVKTLFLFAFIPSVISYFMYYFVVFPKYLQQKRYILSLAVGILISIVSAITVIIVMTFIGIICGIVALVINGFITWFNEIKLKESLKEKNHEMEMALVKLQLDPHLLFNTINNIDALILKDTVAASDYLNKLSDIMRFILYETKGDKILLSKEIEYIDKYIALQKIRTANELYVHLTVNGSTGSKTIAPMVFIPFIENAFKHANNKKIENAISVHIIIHEETVQLVCENKFDSKLKTQHPVGGLGNELIEKRLNLLYAGKHRLEVNRTADLYSIQLTIPHG